MCRALQKPRRQLGIIPNILRYIQQQYNNIFINGSIHRLTGARAGIAIRAVLVVAILRNSALLMWRRKRNARKNTTEYAASNTVAAATYQMQNGKLNLDPEHQGAELDVRYHTPMLDR